MYNILTMKGGVTLPNAKGTELDPFSREIEQQELDRLGLKIAEVQRLLKDKRGAIEEKEKQIKALKEERAKKEAERAVAVEKATEA